MTPDTVLNLCLFLAFSNPPLADALADHAPTPQSHPDLLAPRNVLGPSDLCAARAPSTDRYAGYEPREELELELLNDPSLDEVGAGLGEGDVYVTPETDLLSAVRVAVAGVEGADLFAIKRFKPPKRDGNRTFSLGRFLFKVDVAR